LFCLVLASVIDHRAGDFEYAYPAGNTLEIAQQLVARLDFRDPGATLGVEPACALSVQENSS
jgi:hypothetical protein